MTPVFTEHARLRMAAMGVSTRRVKRALYAPEHTRVAGSGHRAGRHIVVGDGLAIVVSDDDGAVITVLWADPTIERRSA